MPKIIATHWITLDGYIADANGELDFVRGEDQLGDYELDIIGSAGHLLFGRNTYEQLFGYWSQVPENPKVSGFERAFAAKINPLEKSVLSRSLKEADWENSQILNDIEAVAELKQTASGDILIYGSASIVQELTRRELIDEYHLLVHPVLLGEGKSLFAGAGHRLSLKKVRQDNFDSGVVLDVYRKS